MTNRAEERSTEEELQPGAAQEMPETSVVRALWYPVMVFVVVPTLGMLVIKLLLGI